MFWKLLAVIGALSFVTTGLGILFDSDCQSVDFSGGRAILASCRFDDAGLLPGPVAGLGLILVGLLIVYFFIPEVKVFLSNLQSNRSTTLANRSEVPTGSDESDWSYQRSIKICAACKVKVSLTSQECQRCKSVVFTQKQIFSNSADPHSLDEVTRGPARLAGESKSRTDEVLMHHSPSSKSDNVKIDKFCNSCASIVPTSYTECAFCKGISFVFRENPNYQNAKEEVTPSERAVNQINKTLNLEPKIDPIFKTCPMCAEDIKFAAKKCRYCGSLI